MPRGKLFSFSAKRLRDLRRSADRAADAVAVLDVSTSFRPARVACKAHGGGRYGWTVQAAVRPEAEAIAEALSADHAEAFGEPLALHAEGGDPQATDPSARPWLRLEPTRSGYQPALLTVDAGAVR